MAELKSSSKIICFQIFIELTDGEMRIFRGMAFQICGAACTTERIDVLTEGFAMNREL